MGFSLYGSPRTLVFSHVKMLQIFEGDHSIERVNYSYLHCNLAAAAGTIILLNFIHQKVEHTIYSYQYEKSIKKQSRTH